VKIGCKFFPYFNAVTPNAIPNIDDIEINEMVAALRAGIAKANE
jgi:hypothetical protein